jgi:EAL domain-containing protein (putative c-di-GMP-specific phosphodiesterase class I)
MGSALEESLGAVLTEGMVRTLLDNGRPEMVFQPVFDLREFGVGVRKVVGFEALARFSSGFGPAQWFLAASRAGLGLELELAAVRAALSRLAELPPDAYLSVNASPSTMTSHEVMEVSEQPAMELFEGVRQALYGFRVLGLQLAVDDVGAGPVSLRQLLRLQPDIIKIDVTLTRDIDQEPDRRALVAALRVFADDIGSVVVVEGIERPSQLDTLLELGVRYGQGFHLAPPAALP